MSKYSMQNALAHASAYIDRRIMDGSKLWITLPHAKHILIVAVSSAIIARRVNPDKEFVEKAFVTGLLHDIGRYIVDEKAAKYPHTIAGYERCKKLKIPFVAPVCLTHAVLDNATHAEYPDYTPEQLNWVNDKMSKIKRSFFDDLAMLVDLHCRGDMIFTIQDRLDKNKSFYKISTKDYSKKYMDLYNNFVKKYNIDIYAVCKYVAEHQDTIFKRLMPYCHGWLRYVCGDKSVAQSWPSSVLQHLTRDNSR